jgi:prephenate dehydrogenase
MTIKMTIVGLGQIGASIGLGLSEQKEKILRIGHDIKSDVMRKAEKMGAVDKTIYNLHDAVEDADIVILAIPVDQVKETLELIASDLKEGSVILDASNNMISIGKWAKEYVPAERYFATITPTVNPHYIDDFQSGIDAAHADLFKKGFFVITSPAGMPADAIRLATELADLLGTTPLYADPMEYDGLSAATNLLPQLLAAALVNATMDQPGWREGRKIAGKAYYRVTEPLIYLEEEKDFGTAARLNQENAVRVINDMIIALKDIRDAISDEESNELENLMRNAVKARDTWLQERFSADWDRERRAEVPSSGESLARFFTGGLFKKRDDKKKR